MHGAGVRETNRFREFGSSVASCSPLLTPRASTVVRRQAQGCSHWTSTVCLPAPHADPAIEELHSKVCDRKLIYSLFPRPKTYRSECDRPTNCVSTRSTSTKPKQTRRLVIRRLLRSELSLTSPPQVSGGHAPAGRASGSGSALTAIAEVPEEEEGGVTGAVEQDLSPPVRSWWGIKSDCDGSSARPTQSLDTPKRDGGQDLVQLSAISSAVHPAATLTECAGFNLCNPMQVDDSVSCVVVNEVGGLSEGLPLSAPTP